MDADLRDRKDWKATNCLFLLSGGRVGLLSVVNVLSMSPSIAAFHEPPPRQWINAEEAYAALEQHEEKYLCVFIKT